MSVCVYAYVKNARWLANLTMNIYRLPRLQYYSQQYQANACQEIKQLLQPMEDKAMQIHTLYFDTVCVFAGKLGRTMNVSTL